MLATDPQTSPKPAFLETVPVLWPDSTIVCIGSGPSLKVRDIQEAFDRGARLLAVNDAVRLTGNIADVLFAADAKWWKWHKDVQNSDLPIHLWTVDPEARQYRQNVRVVNYNGHAGFERSRCSIRTGGHSGYMAVHMAAHFGGIKIILLGYDMQAAPIDPTGMSPELLHHFFGDHPDGNHLRYEIRRGVYQTLVDPFAKAGIRVFNASRATALTVFPRCTLAEAFEA